MSKVDISTDDVITPKEVKYEYKLMFEERSIPVLAYNLETVLPSLPVSATGFPDTKEFQFSEDVPFVNRFVMYE